MDEDLFKKIYGGAIKNVRSLEEIEKEEEDYKNKVEEAKERQRVAEEKRKKEQEDKKSWGQKLLEGAGDLGSKMVAGVQQGAGRVADVAVQGGALLDEAANQLQGGSEKEKQQRRLKNLEGTEKLRDLIHSQKDIRGESISGTKGADEAASKIASGNGDVKDFARVAGEGLEVGLDATQFANPTSLLKGGVTATAGSSVARNAAGEIVKVTAKDAAKAAAKDAALFGGLESVKGTAKTYGETGDLGKALEEGAKQGLMSAVTQGAFNMGGYAIGRGVGRIKNGKGKADAGDIANVDGAAGKVDVENTAPTSGTQFSKISDDELARQIEQFQTGERTADRAADYKRYQELRDEAQFRVDQKDKASFLDNGLPNDVKGAKQALKDFDDGNIPESATRPMKPDIKHVSQIFANENMPVELKAAAQEVLDDQGKVNTMLDGLMNDRKYNQAHLDMDRAYNERLKEIQQMPEPRYVAERQKLDAQYKDDLAELEMIREKDLPEVEKWNEIKDRLDQRGKQVVDDTNMLIANNPDKFRAPDEVEVKAQRERLVNNLEQAKRFDNGSAELSRVANSSNPEAELRRSPEARDKVAQVVSESQIAKTKDAVAKLSDREIAASRATSPSQMLEKGGLRDVGFDPHSELIKGTAKANAMNKADVEKLKAIKEVLPKSKEELNQIVDYLEGKRSTLSLGNEKAATLIREFLDEKKELLDEAGFRTFKEFYFPHIKEHNSELYKHFFGDVKASGDINFGNLKSRKTNSDTYSRDVMEVLTSYASGLNEKLTIEPALKKLDDVSVQLKLAKDEVKNAAQYADFLDNYIKQVKGQNKSNAEVMVNQMVNWAVQKFGGEPKNYYAQALGTQRMISAAATMGLSVSTAIRQSSQLVNSIAGIGTKWASVGLVDGIHMLSTKAGRAELRGSGIFDGGLVSSELRALAGNGTGGRISNAASAGANALLALTTSADTFFRAAAYAGAKAKAKSMGLVGEEAINYAIRKTTDTQFMTSKLDMPLAFNGQGIRSLTQLATFTGKQAGFMARTAKGMVERGADGKLRLNAKATGNIVAAAAVATLLTETLKPIMGMRETEWIPFYDQVAPYIGALTGKEVKGGDGIYRSPLVQLMFGDGKNKTGLMQALQGKGFDKFWEDNWSGIVPAGTQLKKSVEGYESTTTGASRNSKGKLRYLQDMDQNSVINATIFGQYTTEAGRKWIKDGFPTLSDKQADKVDSQETRELKQQYYDFYSAIDKVKGRKEALEEARDAATLGDQNRARRVATEYNEKVRDALSDYYSKHDEIPPKLKKELEQQVFINASRIRKNRSRTEE